MHLCIIVHVIFISSSCGNYKFCSVNPLTPFDHICTYIPAKCTHTGETKAYDK